MKTIAIIGGGLSGTLLAIHLLSVRTSIPIRMYLFEKSGTVGAGLAYRTPNPAHLLNVRAGNMSLFADQPDHFVHWLHAAGERYTDDDFVPRYLFGRYVRDVFRQQRDHSPHSVTVEIIADEVVRISAGGCIHGRSGAVFSADRIVLALGNFPPAHLTLPDMEYVHHAAYVANPWSPDALQDLPRQHCVVLIGASLTAIDVIISLAGQGHTGEIIALSTHGALPLVHGDTRPYPPFFRELPLGMELSQIVATVKRHLYRANATGHSWQSVVDAIRPDVPALWQTLPEADKRQFLRHLSHRWNIARHRMPESSAALLHRLSDKGQLTVKATKITAITPAPEDQSLRVSWQCRRSHRMQAVTASRVINCTGPPSDPARVESPLLRQLMDDQLVRSDSLRLGLDATPDGRLYTGTGALSDTFYAIGPLLKGVVWECVSVPEIRQHAQQLAALLVNSVTG